MSLLGNILWVVLGGGWAIFVEYMIGGLILCLTIIGIPFGLQCFRIGVLGLLPFGTEVVDDPDAQRSLVTLLMNILWVVVAGIWIALSHVVLALLCAITIIGIPFAVQHMKLARLAFTPFGKRLRKV